MKRPIQYNLQCADILWMSAHRLKSFEVLLKVVEDPINENLFKRDLVKDHEESSEISR